MKKLLLYLLMFPLLYSCSDDENVIDKDQLTLGIWYYEYESNLLLKSTTLTFNTTGTYTRENVYFDPTGDNDTAITDGTWAFANDNVIDLTGFGTCLQRVGGPPCTSPDIDFKILQLKKEFLEIEELVNGSPSALPSKTRYINIKP